MPKRLSQSQTETTLTLLNSVPNLKNSQWTRHLSRNLNHPRTTILTFKESPPAPTPVQPKSYSRSNPSFTTDHLFLVEEIERTTGDTWSRGYFVNLVRQIDEQIIWAALSVTREKMALESGVNGGAYFSSTVRGMAGLQGLNSHRSSPVTPKEFDVGPQDSKKPPHVSSPEPEPLDEIDPTALVKGWRVMYRPGNVSSVLSQVGRCLPGWDGSLDMGESQTRPGRGQRRESAW